MNVTVRRTHALGVLVFLGLAGLTAVASPVTAQDNGHRDPSLFSGLDYRLVGPTRGGRSTAVAGHRAHPATFYMGTTGGGMWKTTDYGVTWLPIGDQQIATGSIGAVRVADSDPDILYVGTGSDGIRSNVIIGKGIYRSDDAGENWRLLGLEEAGQIGGVAIHPTNPDLVYAAALGNPWGRNDERGVFRTKDGGRNWEKVLFTSDSVGAIDIEMHPTNPSILYASMWRGQRKPWTIISGMKESAREDGIWRSTDAGDTWEYVALNLPSGLIGKIDFAVSPAAPDRVYAVVETLEPEEGLYRSDDAGRTWRLVSNHGPLMDRPFYYTNVDADPTNADVVYVNATQFWKSVDGGQTWERRSTPHGDNHDMWINPDDPDLMVQANDGGVNVTRDGGETWSTQMNQPTAELYQVDIDDQFPYWLYAGQQDNTTIKVPSAPPAEGSVVGPEGWWKDVGGCETGPAVPKPGNPAIVYSNCKGRFGRYSEVTGQEQQYYVGGANLYGHNPKDLEYRFQRVVPIVVSPHDADVVYHGSQYVHRTTDDGRTWETISPDLTAFRPERQVASGEPITRDITGEEHYSVLYEIAPSPHSPDVIWTGANDGPVHVTRDGGRNWVDVTPPDMPPEGRIQHIDVSPHRPGKAYVAGYRILLGDLAPYAYRTEDYGRTWTKITDGIPGDYPVRVVREDKVREGLLFGGTEYGMFISFDDGANWQPFQLDLPISPITDLKVVGDDIALSTMGRSFWILDDLSPLRQIDEADAARSPFLHQPLDAHRIRWGGGGYGGGDDEGPSITPEAPPTGAVIDYVLPRPAQNVRIDILDASGAVVRGFESQGPGRTVEEGQEMRAPFRRTTGSAAPSADQGHHRFVWDLSYAAPGGGRRGGPTAVPGDYQVRLTADGETRDRRFRVLIDPRVEADGVTVADLRSQFDLSMQVLQLMGEARQTMERVETHLERVEDAGGDRAAQALSELRELRSRLVDEETGSYPQPMLVSQINYLYGMISRADQPPGQDAFQRYRVLEARLQEIRKEIERIERMVADVVE